MEFAVVKLPSVKRPRLSMHAMSMKWRGITPLVNYNYYISPNHNDKIYSPVTNHNAEDQYTVAQDIAASKDIPYISLPPSTSVTHRTSFHVGSLEQYDHRIV